MPAEPASRPGAHGKRAPDWRRAIASFTVAPTDLPEFSETTDAASAAPHAGRPAAAPRPLALQFELRRDVPRRPGEWQGRRDEPARRAASVDRLAVRPVTAGARGRWVKSGLTWQNIAYQASAGGFDHAQSRWFGQFALLKGGSTGVYQPSGSEWISLDEFESPLLWALLAEARRLGIALAGSTAAPAVVVHDAASVALDATIDDVGDLMLEPIVRFGAADDLRSVQHVRRIGEHGLYRFDFDAGVLDVAPLEAPLGPAEVSALEGGLAVRVPAAEVPEFARGHVHRLARSIAIVSRDDSFTPPVAPPATLVLDARHEPGDLLRLAWRWEHADGRRTPVDASVATSADDPDLDDDLLARVVDALGWVPLEAVLLRGADAAEFTVERMPRLERLAERGPLRIDVRGIRPDYRRAEGEPRLTVTAVESLKADWFDLGVQLTVDGRPVPFQRLFTALAKGRRRLLLVDKTYLSLADPLFDPLRELIEEAGTVAEWETGTLPIHRSRAGLWADFEDLAHEAEPAVAWRRIVEGLSHGGVEELPPPEGLALPLRPYQLAGFRWLAFLWANRLGGVLADDMGLGKTAQALALIQHARNSAVEEGPAEPVPVVEERPAEPDASRNLATRQGLDTPPSVATRPPTATAAPPFLVVAPTSVASNWVREASRFTPDLRVATVTATEARRRGRIAEAAASADVVVTTYAVLRLEADAFAALEWSGLVLDEAQFVKNSATKVHEAARGIRAPFRLAMTGTPIENHVGELWAILRIVAPGLFPSRRAFDETYRRPIEQDGNAERRERLRRRIRPLILRRSKELVAPELPPKQEQLLAVELAPKHRRLYDATLQRERQKLLGLVDDLDRQRFIVYRSLTLLRMLALDAALIDEERYAGYPSAKLDALFEQLDDVLAEGHRALVFSQFTSFLGRAKARLDAAGISYAYLDGSTPVRRRDAEIARFRAGEASVFLISLKAGGFGLNLTEADYVFLLDPWWNPASEAQAVDRAHRIGQAKQVMVYRLVAQGTIEEKVMALKARKGELVASILDARADAAGPRDGDADAPGGAASPPAPADLRAAEALTAADLRELLDG
ncbi:DEAD/DEAH box helicase [Agromyces sp. NPDC057865]|uniref:DEAD/DEAH box helicase n=1 Tax=Agromyces sp. NPDC057865 TaxID=3346267 RepID=UPI00366C47B9